MIEFGIIKRGGKYLTKEMKWTKCKKLAYQFINKDRVDEIAKELKAEIIWHVMRKV